MEETDNKIVTFHLTTGKKVKIIYTKEEMDSLTQTLHRSGFVGLTIYTHRVGVNGRYITHYEVEK